MKKVMVIYHSQEFGNTAVAARLVVQGLEEVGGIEVKSVNTNEAQRIDMEELAACDGVAIGSPDYYAYLAGTIKQVFDDDYIYRGRGFTGLKGKPCVVFMTHGGDGYGLPALVERADDIMKRVAEPFICKMAPAGTVEREQAIELGRALARAVLG